MPSMFDIPKGYETKMAIIRAMYDLLDEGATIESVTVTDIAERAHIARKTFYQHFETKYNALEWYYGNLIRNSDVPKIGRTVTCEEGLLSALTVYYAERDFLQKAFVLSEDYESVFSISVRWTVEGLKETLTEYCHVDLTPQLLFETDMCAKVLAMAVADWVRRGFVYTPQELATYLMGCVPPHLRKLLDASAQKAQKATSSTPRRA